MNRWMFLEKVQHVPAAMEQPTESHSEEGICVQTVAYGLLEGKGVGVLVCMCYLFQLLRALSCLFCLKLTFK